MQYLTANHQVITLWLTASATVNKMSVRQNRRLQ